MINENEIVMLLIGFGGLFFIIVNFDKLILVRHWKLLTAGFCVLLVSWSATVAEGFVMENVFNYIEHIGYAASSTLVAVWFWKTSATSKKPHA